jgi:GT2 family glycosyltransferase
MNMAIISKEVLNTLGFLSNKFTHGGADYEYGLRIKKNSLPVLLAPGYFGYCSKNPIIGSSFDKSLSVFKRIKLIFSIKDSPLFHKILPLYKGYAGPIWPVHILIYYTYRIMLCLK